MRHIVTLSRRGRDRVTIMSHHEVARAKAEEQAARCRDGSWQLVITMCGGDKQVGRSG